MDWYSKLPAIDDYARAREDFRLELPETLNFAFDVIDGHAEAGDKTAYVFVPADGSESRSVSFKELRASSNRFANALLALGANPGDGVFVMLPRVPAWYDVILGCCKSATVAMPGTNLLTAKDMAYRFERSKARFAVIAAVHVEKIESIREQCPSLEHVIVVGAKHASFHSFDELMASASDTLSRDDAPTTRAGDPMLTYFTSGTTA
ncbi:MAG: AMP-binding protein, partial [Myxococcota bacterium]